MIKEAIGVGETELDALNDAKRQLGISEDEQVDFELIQRAEKKKFGLFGGSPAKVKITLKASPAEAAEEFLCGVIGAMNLDDITIESTTDENSVKFNLSGENVGYVIGRRGETLDALQYLTGLVANHVGNAYFKVTVDTGNYREKRENTLEILGRKLAFKAVKTGKKTSLEPMNPYERRIIHTAVQKVNGATSWSEGENANRHVVVGPDQKFKSKHRGGYNNRGRQGRRLGYTTGSESIEADVTQRQPLNEGGDSGSLYGRIDK